MTLYLLDTNAVSEMLREPMGQVAQRVGLVGVDAVCTSIIVTAEIRYGAAKKRSAALSNQVEIVLEAMLVQPFAAPADEIYGQLRGWLERLGTPIGDNDILIAAHALALDCILVTDNVREFERVPGLKVENWLRTP